MLAVLDVSELQGPIDWPAVASSGVDAVWIRACEGVTPDAEFARNWAGARSVGLPRGAYTFLRARHTADDLGAALLRQLGSDAGELPVMLDAETLDGAQRPAFVELIGDLADLVDLELDRGPLLYTYPAFWAQLHAVRAPALPLWIAHYGVEHPSVPVGWNDWLLWQYTGTGRCPGVSTIVDRSRFRGTLDELLALGVSPMVDAPTEPVAA